MYHCCQRIAYILGCRCNLRLEHKVKAANSNRKFRNRFFRTAIAHVCSCVCHAVGLLLYDVLYRIFHLVQVLVLLAVQHNSRVLSLRNLVKSILLSLQHTLSALYQPFLHRYACCYVLLVCNVLCLLAFQSLNLALRLILQQRKLRARKVGGSICKRHHLLVLLVCAVLLIVLQVFRAAHNHVYEVRLCLQSLIARNVESILYTEVQYLYRNVPLLMQVALSQYTTYTLRQVHRSVRHVHVYQRVQSLLNVHTRSKRTCRAKHYANFALVNLVKRNILCVLRHSASHYEDFLFRHAPLHKFALYLVI